MTPLQLSALLRLAVSQRFTTQSLDRIPEPTMVMDDAKQVEAYHSAGETTLDLIYCFAIELIHTALPKESPLSILDLGCGSGQFTARLAEMSNVRAIRALDASNEMIRLARENPRFKRFQGQIDFEVQDITQLEDVADSSFNLTTCSLTAHHLDAITPDVESLLLEMDRVTEEDGVVFLLDLARLKKRSFVERYVQIFSPGQAARHNEDFLNSMLAAFTPGELADVIPKNSASTHWIHFTSPTLPTIQVAMRVPRSRRPAEQKLWDKSPTTFASNAEWKLLRNQFRKRCLRAWHKAIT